MIVLSINHVLQANIIHFSSATALLGCVFLLLDKQRQRISFFIWPKLRRNS